MKKRLALKVLVLSVLAGLAALVWYWSKNSQEANPSAFIPATGVVEATEVEVQPELSARIQALLVEEGDRVREGELIAQLDKEQLQAQLKLSEAEAAAARARLRDLEAGSRPQEITMAEASLRAARAELERARQDWLRAKELYEQKMLTEQESDRAKATYDVALARAAEAGERVQLLKEGERPQRIEAARAELKRARAALELVRVQLEDTEVRSPLSGTVAIKHAEEGEVGMPGSPLVTLLDLEDLWVTVYVKEARIGFVKLGQPAEVSVDSYPGKVYTGKVIHVSDEAEFTPKAVQTPEERVKLVFAVKVAVENPRQELKPGMPADVRINTGESAP